MNDKFDGVGIAHPDQHATPELRRMMNGARHATSFERSAAQRRERIATVAYYLSEARGFAPGYDAEDWALAQARVDAEDAGNFDN